ncbi:isochorismatase family protein [Bdellovibrio sp. KM01]|uniref:isochorismatase family protein n=1 Tax=Bdellovibrio sp. KM01 TaxID=2748865 RepID=UPI0015EA1B13|nr:isochorismatase family protein [Bdellovibrio sp. KM01]QLY26898.1 isochorismatase family protein [Bdellovibrio sp. KM01]
MKLFITLLFSTVISMPGWAEEICKQNSGNAALVVIDMQAYFAERNGAYETPENKKKIKDLQQQQMDAITKARQSGIPIIFIEYDLDPESSPTNPNLKQAAFSYEKTHTFLKDTDGMFDRNNKYRDQLIAYVQKNNIGTLLITGANGGACVYQSIKGALNGNCNVVAYNKGIADFNFEDFIYPYAGYYKDMRYHCSNCSFKETASIDRLEDSMITVQSGAGPTRLRKGTQ